MQPNLNLPNPLAACESLFTDHGVALTTSRAVAERFGKRHDNVVRDIQKLIAELDALDISLSKIGESDRQVGRFSLLNFEKSTYQNSRGKNYTEYHLTHDGFALLVMGFIGRDAMAWEFAFIQAFNALETELKSHVAREAAALHQLRPLLCPCCRGHRTRSAPQRHRRNHRTICRQRELPPPQCTPIRFAASRRPRFEKSQRSTYTIGGRHD